MASTIYRVVLAFPRTKTSIFRRAVLSNVPTKLMLPSCSNSISITQMNIFHTSSVNRERLFELEKNRKQGTTHWLSERVVAVTLLVLIPPAILSPHIVIDHAFAVLLPLHSYWGVKAIIGDYLWRPAVPALKVGWLVICVLSSLGLFALNVNDVGVSQLFGNLMMLKND